VTTHRTDDRDFRDSTPGYPGLAVDLNGIDDFVAALRKEVEANLQPQIEHLLTVYETGVCFGYVSRSENMAATQQVYHDCLTRISGLLGAYATAGQVLTAAAEQVARAYRHTDAMAAANTQYVSDAISTQVRAAQNATPAPVTRPFTLDRRLPEP
jgi:hypothetical protein